MQTPSSWLALHHLVVARKLRESEFPSTSKGIQYCWHSIRSHNHSCNNMAKQWGLHSGRYFNVWACGPAKFEGWKFCHCPSTTAWPFCCSCGCGFWLYASDVELPCLCLEISTSGQHPAAWQFAGCLADWVADWLAGSCCTLLCVWVGGREIIN